MADQHLLTDETCDGLVWFSLDGLTELSEYDYVIMRAAADWQLEQVIEWLEANLMNHDPHKGWAYLFDDYSNAYIKDWEILEDLKKAMRPTQEDN